MSIVINIKDVVFIGSEKIDLDSDNEYKKILVSDLIFMELYSGGYLGFVADKDQGYMNLIHSKNKFSNFDVSDVLNVIRMDNLVIDNVMVSISQDYVVSKNKIFDLSFSTVVVDKDLSVILGDQLKLDKILDLDFGLEYNVEKMFFEMLEGIEVFDDQEDDKDIDVVAPYAKKVGDEFDEIWPWPLSYKLPQDEVI